jgi:hypothetical protein
MAKAMNIETSVEGIATMIRDGIGKTLEIQIKAELLKHIDPIISELARDLANSTKTAVQGYYAQDVLKGPSVNIHLAFNNTEVTYEAERTNPKRSKGDGTS